MLFEWSLLDEFDAGAVALRVPDDPNVWTDGSLVLGKVSGASSSGSGFYAHLPGQAWRHPQWEHLDRSADRMRNSCRGSGFVLGPLQTVERAEFSGVLLALQASDAIHLGVDNLYVVRQVGRLLDGVRSSCPAEVMHDGDPIMLIGRIFEQSERDTVRGMLMRNGSGSAGTRVGQIMRLMRLLILGAVG